MYAIAVLDQPIKINNKEKLNSLMIFVNNAQDIFLAVGLKIWSKHGRKLILSEKDSLIKKCYTTRTYFVNFPAIKLRNIIL